jgi:NAD(P)-dependent dehydrogenase (short-subunit alcohol dehydrogenase family)
MSQQFRSDNLKVFVTGATGFIGYTTVQELIHAGHQVLGIARSEAGAQSRLSAPRSSGRTARSSSLPEPEWAILLQVSPQPRIISMPTIQSLAKARKSQELPGGGARSQSVIADLENMPNFEA